MENLRNSNNKRANKKGKFSKFAPILAGALFLMNPSGTEAQNVSNQVKAKTEVSASTILNRLNQKVGVPLPAEYNGKVLDFVLNDTIMRTRSATAYTEEFIINEMKKDRGIDKQNQLLFIRSEIYGGITGGKLYDILDDEDDNRYDDYSKASKQIATSYENYKKGFKTYMETGITEADRRSAEADRRSAEADRDIIQKDTLGLKEMAEFYSLYIKNPNNVKKEEIEKSKELLKRVIPDCKKYGIDYKAILLKEVGDKKKVGAILKFYGVE